jgi:heme-degrading monooxygenase HmoA
MAIYLSMQRARFSSAAGYEKFKNIFADVRHHLKTLPGFLHLTFWVHPEDPGWYNEISLWTSKEALQDWHMNTYHKHAKEWACAVRRDIGGHHHQLRARQHQAAAHLPGLQQVSGQALRPGKGTTGARPAVSAMRLSFPGYAGDAEQLCRIQGRRVIVAGASNRRQAGA